MRAHKKQFYSNTIIKKFNDLAWFVWSTKVSIAHIRRIAYTYAIVSKSVAAASFSDPYNQAFL